MNGSDRKATATDERQPAAVVSSAGARRQARVADGPRCGTPVGGMLLIACLLMTPFADVAADALPDIVERGSAGETIADARIPADPLRSVMWEDMAERFFPGGPIVFDERVQLSAPRSAEDQFHVPVTVDATALDDVVEIVAVADLNPIPHVLTLRPTDAEPFVGFRLKLQQTSPVHVGVRTGDGTWHVAGAVIDAAGGGCTAPAMMHGEDDWMSRLGETRALVVRESAGVARLALRMRHPMDTGLAAGIPAFYMSILQVETDTGEPLVTLELFEPVSENPTVVLKPRAAGERLRVRSRDTEANRFAFTLDVPALAN